MPRAAPLLVLLLCALSPEASADRDWSHLFNPKGKLFGCIFDDGGGALGDARIVLDSASLSKPITTRSDRCKFKFPDLPPGVYSIYATFPGYDDFYKYGVPVFFNDTTWLQIELARPEIHFRVRTGREATESSYRGMGYWLPERATPDQPAQLVIGGPSASPQFDTLQKRVFEGCLPQPEAIAPASVVDSLSYGYPSSRDATSLHLEVVPHPLVLDRVLVRVAAAGGRGQRTLMVDFDPTVVVDWRLVGSREPGARSGGPVAKKNERTAVYEVTLTPEAAAAGPRALGAITIEDEDVVTTIGPESWSDDLLSASPEAQLAMAAAGLSDRMLGANFAESFSYSPHRRRHASKPCMPEISATRSRFAWNRWCQWPSVLA